MPVDPLAQPCLHRSSPEEQHRDPGYTGCTAQPGQPCVWAKRHDGLEDPPFHAERIESACGPDGAPATLSKEAFDDIVLGSGLV